MINQVNPRLGAGAMILGTLVLAGLAFGGSVLSVPLYFGVDFIFGSVFAMLAVRLLGTLPAVIVAAVGGAYTVILWGHPYALLIFTLEALVVGILYRRGLRNLLLADLVYWVVIGAPWFWLSIAAPLIWSGSPPS